jgi:hypothetical protein
VSRRQPASRPTLGARGRDDDPVATFVRAATVGAFVGAVIAGSTVWHRIRRRIAAGTAAGRPGPRPASPRHDPVGPRRPDGGAGRQ